MRYLGPPAHVSTGSNLPITRIVVHGTVSPCVPGGAARIAAYFRTEAARGSAHYVVDPDEAVSVAADDAICWHAPPNRGSIGVELCDPQSGPAARWHDPAHQKMLVNAAELVADLCTRHRIPVRKLTADGLAVGGLRGICGHADVTQAFHQSDHTDPGLDFPWTMFLGLVRGKMLPPGKPPTLARWLPSHPRWTRVLQRKLHVPITGRFDRPTADAVLAFKRAHGLRPAYRICGPRVWKLLGL